MSDPIISISYWDNVRQFVQADGKLTLDGIRFAQDVLRRLGGPNADYITQVQEVAEEAKILIWAAQANATAALAFTVTPADPLSYTNASETLATVAVAQHTRSTSGTPYQAGSVSSLTRGAAYIIYSSDPGDAGGAVTYLATADPRTLTNNHRVVGAIYLPSPPIKTNPV